MIINKRLLLTFALISSIHVYSNDGINSSINNQSTNNISVDNGLHLEGLWEIDIDFDQLFVRIYGKENTIKNTNDIETKPLRFTILLVENEPMSENKTISGYKVIDIDIDPIKANTEVKNTIIESNFTNRIPQGTYYPILILSELDDDGIYKTKSTIRYKNKYTL